MFDAIKSLLKKPYVIIPLILGTIGLCLSGEEWQNSIFYSLQMYVLNYSDPPANTLIEIARWLAPIMTVSVIALMFEGVRTRIKNFFLYFLYKFRGKKLLVMLGVRDILIQLKTFLMIGKKLRMKMIS